MNKKAKRAAERDAAVLKLWLRLVAKLPTGTRRVELDLEFADGSRIKREARG